MTDTLWVRVNEKLLPGARGGVSYGPLSYRYVDFAVHNDVLYEYKMESVSYANEKRAFGPILVQPGRIFPVKFMLWNNYPNPFRHYTIIRFDLPIRAKVSLRLYTMQGRMVRELIKPERGFAPDWHQVRWDGRDEFGRHIASGPYVYRLIAFDEKEEKPKYAKAKVMICVK